MSSYPPIPRSKFSEARIKKIKRNNSAKIEITIIPKTPKNRSQGL